MKFETFESWFGLTPGATAHQVVALAHPSSSGDRTPPKETVDDSVTAVARVNHGRWVASCPWGCSDVELVGESGLFFCAECRNAPVKHALIRVAFPEDADAIEGALLERDERSTRNWRPPHTVDDLKRENDEHKKVK